MTIIAPQYGVRCQETRFDPGCVGKRGFDTPIDASRAAKKTAQRTEHRFSTYLCKTCGKYHYGTSVWKKC